MESETLKEYGTKGYLKSSSDSEEWKSLFPFILAFPFTGRNSLQVIGLVTPLLESIIGWSVQLAVNKAAHNWAVMEMVDKKEGNDPCERAEIWINCRGFV